VVEEVSCHSSLVISHLLKTKGLMMHRYIFIVVIGFIALPARAEPLPGFRVSPWFGEQVREEWVADGVRVLVNASTNIDLKKPTRLIFFATPNGNSIEQTLGCVTNEKVDWHFDIQHVAAQVRKLRDVTQENIVLACLEADGLSWPAWKRVRNDGPAVIRTIVETVRGWLPQKEVRLTLSGHSGGGSFLFGFINAHETIPEAVERIIFLDANYSYNDIDKHGDKLLKWLNADQTHRLVVIAYDDRNIMLNNKPVIGPDGGTFRATERMRTYFAKEVPLTKTEQGDFLTHSGLDRQLSLTVHTNPKNRILHTALVGDMNGLLHGLTIEDVKPTWGTFGGPRAYSKFVQPAPIIPKRQTDAVGGKKFFEQIAKLTPTECEEALATEISRGNMPDFLRIFQQVTIKVKDPSGKEHTALLEVMPDYLAIGSDSDFVRVPMTPQTALRIADVFGCNLPTRKIVDEVYSVAKVKLEPRPLTQDRESTATFLQHHAMIEEQRQGKTLGDMVAGIKKDVVVSNRLDEKANRVAIYGWHKLDGKPIQPLNVAHVNWYVDYSHGVRLVKRTVLIDGKPRELRHVLYTKNLASLLSDEGPLRRPTY
jgi:hypothetical protein